MVTMLMFRHILPLFLSIVLCHCYADSERQRPNLALSCSLWHELIACIEIQLISLMILLGSADYNADGKDSSNWASWIG